MNKARSSESEQHRTLHILNELSDNGSVTQRELSSQLGIALGLVNSYVKNLITKGYVRIKAIPPKRYAYYLTPKGFTEKTRLTYHLLQNYTRIYRQARSNLTKLFSELQRAGVEKVVFAGADEVAEIAYLTLQETELELAGIIDDEKAGKKFFGREILPISNIVLIRYDSIVITSYAEQESVYDKLLGHHVERQNIKTVFSLEEGG